MKGSIRVMRAFSTFVYYSCPVLQAPERKHFLFTHLARAAARARSPLLRAEFPLAGYLELDTAEFLITWISIVEGLGCL